MANKDIKTAQDENTVSNESPPLLSPQEHQVLKEMLHIGTPSTKIDEAKITLVNTNQTKEGRSMGVSIGMELMLSTFLLGLYALESTRSDVSFTSSLPAIIGSIWLGNKIKEVTPKVALRCCTYGFLGGFGGGAVFHLLQEGIKINVTVHWDKV